MLRVAICDDDKILLGVLEREVRFWARERQEPCSVEPFAAAEAFLFAWEEKKDMDVLLLDIEMPGMDGLKLARLMRGKGDRTGIIFVTGNPEYALEGYDLEAVSYLVKPVKRERLHTALDRAREKAGRGNAILAPVCAGEVERVYVSDIWFLEGAGHETILRKRDGADIVCKARLQVLEQELTEKSEAFFKPHRSYLINLEHVERITKKEIQMEGGVLIPIARGKWESLNRAYMVYYRNRFVNSET